MRKVRGFLLQLPLLRRIGLDFGLLCDLQRRQRSQVASSEPEIGDGLAVAGFAALFPQAFG
jgi:hypothetical protein